MVSKWISNLRSIMKSEQASHVRSKQWGLFILTLLIVITISCLLMYLTTNEKIKPGHSKSVHVNMASPINNLDAGELWLRTANNKLQAYSKEIIELKNQIKVINSNIARIPSEKNNHTNKDLKIDKEIADIKRKISILSRVNVNNKVRYDDGNKMNKPKKERVISDGIASFHINKNNQKNKKMYIPTGSHVKAVLLNGITAATSVTGQANPRPILLRIVNPVYLPNHKFVDLTNCMLTAAGVGDISSERVYIRLERLSCAQKNKAIIDLDVYGTVVGNDGRIGIHGHVVWADQRLIKNSFTAGLFSGLGHSLSQRYEHTEISPISQTHYIHPNHILEHAVSNGSSTALERLADYYLKRADQYHPVVEINAGSKVDVVFLKKGISIDEN